MDILLVLTLFCMFTISAMLLTMFGAQAYQKIVARSQEEFKVKTPLAYVAAKLRSAYPYQTLRIERGGESDSFSFTEGSGILVFETKIYILDGKLMELTAVAGAGIDPANGQTIVELDELRLEKLSDGLYSISVRTADGETESMAVYLRSRIEEGS